MIDTSEALVSCHDLSVDFVSQRSGTQRVLDRLALSVPTGNVVSLLGASGCGKSTLLRVIAGLIEPTDGNVLIDGQSHSKRHRHVKDRMSFVFQEAALMPWRTVLQNVSLPLELRGGHSAASTRPIVEHWLQVVGLQTSDWNKKPSQLSGGMKMRASIARAMTTDPQILLMDEPFAALDDVLRSKLNDLLLKIAADENRTVLFVTHNISEAVYISDRIAVMSAGKIAEVISVEFNEPRTAQLRGSTKFAEVYGRVSDVLFRAAS